jgi:hypothetical protein
VAWYEITCRSGGSNLNAGTQLGVGEEPVAPLLTNTNGGYDTTTRVFTCSGAPDLSVLSASMMVTIAPDAESSTNPVNLLAGRIASFDNTAKTVTMVPTPTGIGSVPTAASGYTLRVGGAKLGPNGTTSHPLNFGISALTGSSNPLRYNLKNDQTYNVTAGVSHNSNSTRVQGYTNTFGDGGKFILDGGVVGASYTLFTSSSNNSELYDAEIRNNGATGNQNGLIVSGLLFDLRRVVVHDVRGNGIFQQTNRGVQTECETYNCNQSNTSGTAGYGAGSNVPVLWMRCVARDNTTANSRGWYLSSGAMFVLRDCVADSNGSHGIEMPTQSIPTILTGCDFYGNGGSGFFSGFSTTTILKTLFATDCNFFGNGSYGINLVNNLDGNKNGRLVNCAFGSGTAANTSGATNALGDTVIEDSVTFTANLYPWVDPAAGNFTPQGQALGRGTQFVASSGTTSKPDRAAAQLAAGSVVGTGGGAVVSSGF